MKSKVLSYPDINSIKLRDDQRMVERCNIDEEIEKELADIKRKCSLAGKRSAGEKLKADDAVVLNVSCGAEGAPAKFNRSGLGIKLGKFFYDKNLEEELMRGHAVGDVFKAAGGKEGEWPLEVEIVSADYTEEREPADEDYRNEGLLNGVVTNNKEEYVAFLREAIVASENLLHYYDHIIDDLVRELTAESEFEIDPDELEADIRNWYLEVEDLPDYPESDEDDGFIPYVQDMLGSSSDTREALEKELREYYENSFKYNLILMDLAKDEPDPSRESLEALKKELKEQGMSEDEIEETCSYEQYVKNHKLEAGQERLLEIIEKQYLN